MIRENDIGITAFSPAIQKDNEYSWALLDQLKSPELVVTLCVGNAYRSRVSKRALNLLGTPAISAAVGDISKQKNNVFPPDSVLSFMSEEASARGVLPVFRPARMRVVTDLMIASAKFILAFCDEQQLKHVIDLSDSRLHLLHVEDPKTPQDYRNTYNQVTSATVNFYERHFPNKLTTPPNIGASYDSRTKLKTQKIYSVVPVTWGNPLTEFDTMGIEIF